MVLNQLDSAVVVAAKVRRARLERHFKRQELTPVNGKREHDKNTGFQHQGFLNCEAPSVEDWGGWVYVLIVGSVLMGRKAEFCDFPCTS